MLRSGLPDTDLTVLHLQAQHPRLHPPCRRSSSRPHRRRLHGLQADPHVARNLRRRHCRFDSSRLAHRRRIAHSRYGIPRARPQERSRSVSPVSRPQTVGSSNL